MNIPPFWARGTYTGRLANGREHTTHAWGWSSESEAAARVQAQDRAKRVLDALSREETPDHYDYGVTPLREEIVERVQVGTDVAGVITRNRYGALVLNTPDVAFVDIDAPQYVRSGFIATLKALFSNKAHAAQLEAARAAAAKRIEQWIDTNRSRAGRWYETAAGWRLLLTDKRYDPKSDGARRLLEELGSDIAYRRMTDRQACFRARLTPKPWRCGLPPPPTVFPWSSPDDEPKARAWEREYDKAARGYTTCRLLKRFGADANDAAIKAIAAVHDKVACGTGTLA